MQLNVKPIHATVFLLFGVLIGLAPPLNTCAQEGLPSSTSLSDQSDQNEVSLTDPPTINPASALDLNGGPTSTGVEAIFGLSEATDHTAPQTITQVPESETVGLPPSLKTQPAAPDELPFQPSKTLLQRTIRYSPSITLLTPSAYGKSWGQISVGGSFLSRIRYRSGTDRILGVGFGLGDSQKAVGLDVGIGISSVTKFDRGTISFKVHHRFGNQLALAVGVNNALTWGRDLTGISPYGVITKGFQLQDDPSRPFSQIFFSAGAGTGRYRSEDDNLNRRNTVGVFGSVAVRVIEPMNLVAEWSGQDLTLGVSILPFRNLPLVFTPAVTDITGTAGDGPRFTIGVGLGFKF